MGDEGEPTRTQKENGAVPAKKTVNGPGWMQDRPLGRAVGKQEAPAGAQGARGDAARTGTVAKADPRTWGDGLFSDILWLS